jgi:hypothetical protein
MVGNREINPGGTIESEQTIVIGKIDLSRLILGSIPVLSPCLVDFPRVVPDRWDAYIDALGKGGKLTLTHEN